MHFETQSCYSVLRQGILTSCALTSSHLDNFSDIVTYINVMIIYFFLGGGGEAGRFGGGKLLPLKYPR